MTSEYAECYESFEQAVAESQRCKRTAVRKYSATLERIIIEHGYDDARRNGIDITYSRSVPGNPWSIRLYGEL